jgi:hypothetical protein
MTIHAYKNSALSTLVETEILPILKKSEQEALTRNGMPKQLKLPLYLGFGAFIASFLSIKSILPNNGLGEAMTFVLFPVLFFGCFILCGYLFRERLAQIFAKGQRNFLLRTDVMLKLSRAMGLDYIAVPGGPSPSLKKFAAWSKCPQTIKDIVSLMEAHSGLGPASEIIRASGLAVPEAIFLGSEESKERYFEQQLNEQQFEDGFKGVHSNIPFSAVEWTETHDDSKIYHLLVAMTLPTTLTGRVEFKNKAAEWPMNPPHHRQQDKVRLLSSDFAKAYKVRATDQMEARLIFDPAVIERLTAYAAQGPVRGVAFDNHIVVDLIGDNRFNILDVMTGAWSEESIEKTLHDFSEMLDFVDAISLAFSVKAKRQLSA